MHKISTDLQFIEMEIHKTGTVLVSCGHTLFPRETSCLMPRPSELAGWGLGTGYILGRRAGSNVLRMRTRAEQHVAELKFVYLLLKCLALGLEKA